MRLMITGRHVAVTLRCGLYRNTHGAARSLWTEAGNAADFLSVEKFHHVAEVVGVVQGRLQAKTSTEEMYASIDEVVDKLWAPSRES